MKPASVILSLTTWKARIADIGLTIFTLLQQGGMFQIVLTLSMAEFPNKEDDLPSDVKLLVRSGQIRVIWVPGNIKSHKKYFYVMQQYKDHPIILVDDDLLYEQDFAANLVKLHVKYPSAIIADRCHLIQCEEKTILPYSKWIQEYKIPGFNNRLFFTSGAGTLFPPGCLTISDAILPDIEYCITADDVLLNILAIRQNVPIYNVGKMPYIEHDSPSIKASALYVANTMGSSPLNDKYIQHYINDFRSRI